METPKRIHLLSSRGDPRLEEDRANGTIKPGMLLATQSTGKVVAHASAAGVHERKFALEDALQGRTIDDNYASGELVFSVHAEPGDVIYGLLKEGEHATPDEFLTSNGDGTLKVASGSDIRVGKALEEVDASDTAGEGDQRIRLRVI